MFLNQCSLKREFIKKFLKKNILRCEIVHNGFKGFENTVKIKYGQIQINGFFGKLKSIIIDGSPRKDFTQEVNQ